MKTTFDLVTIVWQKLEATASLTTDPLTKLTGGIYKTRPTGSTKEDIEINSLGIPNDQLQRGIVNVNIFVPNIPVSVNGIQDLKQPNYPRLKVLTDLAIATLKDVWAGDYTFDVQQQNLIPVDDEQAAETYSNIRLEFININL
jgi:hypothetical protein